MKKNKNEMFKTNGNAYVYMEVGMPFMKEKFLKMLIKDKKANGKIVASFVTILIRSVS